MTPEMTNDPSVLLIAALIAWTVFGLDTWRRRPRKPQQPDAPKTNTWRNRWH